MSQEDIEKVWDEHHIERIPGHDMTNECRLAAALLLERDRLTRVRKELEMVAFAVGQARAQSFMGDTNSALVDQAIQRAPQDILAKAAKDYADFDYDWASQNPNHHARHRELHATLRKALAYLK